MAVADCESVISVELTTAAMVVPLGMYVPVIGWPTRRVLPGGTVILVTSVVALSAQPVRLMKRLGSKSRSLHR